MSKTPICACWKEFVPRYPEEWNVSYWSSGCIKSTELKCVNDGFLEYTGLKLPDTSSAWYSKTMSIMECRKSCLQNCSFTGYANLDIRGGGSGCLLWFDGLIDMRLVLQGGQDLYIRVPASELDPAADRGHLNFSKKMIVGLAVGSTTLIMGLIVLGNILKKKIESPVMRSIFYWNHYKNKLRKEDTDRPTFDLSFLAKATNNFSSTNKLGEGGFGPVYKMGKR